MENRTQMSQIAFPTSGGERMPATASERVAPLYLNLLKHCLTRYIFPETYRRIDYPRMVTWRTPLYSLLRLMNRLLSLGNLELLRSVPFDPTLREIGKDKWPLYAETMIGIKRLDNLEQCIRAVVADNVPGDLIEAGVWRGGATIFMKGTLEALGETERCVWVADSFQGLPRPDADLYPEDDGDILWAFPALAVSAEEVRQNFQKYGLLDNRVRFLEGWFRETMPTAPIETLALLRVDGDLYESTILVLENLYPKVSPGGYVIIDDYALEGCRRAVDDFRARHALSEPLEQADWTCVFWRKASRVRN